MESCVIQNANAETARIIQAALYSWKNDANMAMGIIASSNHQLLLPIIANSQNLLHGRRQAYRYLQQSLTSTIIMPTTT